MRFLLKFITICFREKVRFNCKNNHKCGKLAQFLARYYQSIQLQNVSSYIIYHIKIKVEKNPLSLETL